MNYDLQEVNCKILKLIQLGNVLVSIPECKRILSLVQLNLLGYSDKNESIPSFSQTLLVRLSNMKNDWSLQGSVGRLWKDPVPFACELWHYLDFQGAQPYDDRAVNNLIRLASARVVLTERRILLHLK